MIRALGTALALCLLTIAASAQTGAALDLAAADQPSQGPMIVERVHNGFLGAGYRFTGSPRGRDGFFDGPGRNIRLNGAVGSIGLQISDGS